MASSEASSSSTHISVCYRGHRRRKQSSSPFFTTPSSKLLSLLASLVSASTVDASPVPPPFLCPSIGLDNILQSPSLEKRSPPPGNEQQGNPPTSKRVPDKFERGLDGLWVRVPYTLYGVTTPDPNCNNEGCLGASSNESLPPVTPVDIQLPPGWRPAPPSANRTTMILAVSLALSLFIGFLILVCLFWRKGLFNKRKSQDIEAEDRHENLTAAEHRAIEVEKEAKALQKIWARASARWKANARHSLRQRRGKRPFARLHHQSTTSFVNDSRRCLTDHPSRPPSSLSSPIPIHIQSPFVEERLPNQENQSPASRPPSPPAYHSDHQTPPIIISPSGTNSEYSFPAHLSPQPSLYPFHANRQYSDLNLFPISAHVATDDKALLARLADLTSAPATETDALSLSQGSAPEDVEFEDVIASSTSAQMDSPSLAPLFPPPPSKERLAAAERLEYSFVYTNRHVELESAPPFEEGLPLDESVLFPSAPPTINEESPALGTSFLPSAPSLEDVLVLENIPPDQTQ